MTNYVWNGASAGWSAAGAWVQPGHPAGPGDTATIDASGSYTSTVEAGLSYTLTSLTLNDTTATLAVAGSLVFAGAQDLLTITAGTVELDATGTIANTTIALGAGGFVAKGGTLSAVAFHGPLEIGASGSLASIGGLTVTGTGGTGPGMITLHSQAQLSLSGNLSVGTASAVGTIAVSGDTSVLAIANSQTLDNILIGLSGFDATVSDLTATLSLGANATLEGTSNFGTIAGSLTNQGSIAQTSGFTDIQDGNAPGTFDNQGSVTITASTIKVDATHFTNAGNVDIASGGTLEVSNATTLANSGQLTIESGATLLLDADITLTQLLANNVTSNGGTLSLAGALDLQGATLDLAATGLFSNLELDSGSIRNGAIKPDGGTLVSNSGTFVNVTYLGEFDISAGSILDTVGAFKVTQSSGTGPGSIVFGDNSLLDVMNTLVLGTASALGAIELKGSGADLVFGIGGTLQHASVLMDGANAAITATSGTLTLASDVVATITGDTTRLEGNIVNLGIIAYQGVAGFADDVAAGDTFANQGLITLAVSNLSVNTDNFVNGGSIEVGFLSLLSVGVGTTLANTGEISIASGGTLSFQGPVTLAALQADGVTNNGGVLQIAGNLDLQGGTLDLATTGLFSDVEMAPSGTISDGTILPGGGALTLGGGTFQGVTYRGELDIPLFGSLNVQAGLTVTGATGTGPGIVTLGANTSLNLFGGLNIGSLGSVGALNAFSADATINIDDTETLDHLAFNVGGEGTQIYATNGPLTFGSDATFNLTTTFGLMFGNVVNFGHIVETSGTFDLNDFQSGDALDNRGTTVVTGSTFVANVDTVQNEGLLTVGNFGTVDIGLSSTLVSTGQIVLDDDSVLEFNNSTAADVTYSGRGLLVLDDSFGYTGTLKNLSAGSALRLTDTVIDSASIVGTHLVVHLQGGTTEFYKVSGGSVSGALTVTADANGIFDTVVVPCFLAGTRILTDRGEVAVEALRVGDGVVTLSGSVRPIRWLGVRRLESERHSRPEAILPVRIVAGAFGPGQPSRDLYLSPDHAVYAEGALIPVKHLIDDENIRQVSMATICYHHVELDAHNIVVADGLATESYLDTGDRASFSNGGGATMLHPAFGPGDAESMLVWDALGCAPLVIAGPKLDRTRAMLARNAANRRTALANAG